MTKEENSRRVKQLRELCTFLPSLSQGPQLRRLQLIYERGGRHMLDSDNLQRIVDAAHQHMQELRKLSRLLAIECQLNLARHSQGSRPRAD